MMIMVWLPKISRGTTNGLAFIPPTPPLDESVWVINEELFLDSSLMEVSLRDPAYHPLRGGELFLLCGTKRMINQDYGVVTYNIAPKTLKREKGSYPLLVPTVNTVRITS